MSQPPATISRPRIVAWPLLFTGVFLLAACRPEQSVLHPASQDARDVATLFWGMTLGGAVIWIIVFGAAVYAVLGKNRPKSEQFADRFILVGGVIFPTVVLGALLIFGLRLLPDWRVSDQPDLRIHVTGEQFWWRVRYESAGDETANGDGLVPSRFETANQIYLPRGQLVELALTAQDVIHSFWIPPLGGKLDMIPGRTNLLRLRPSETGRYRGVCAEFCGLSHALMAFEVEVVEPEVFAAWLQAEASPAVGAQHGAGQKPLGQDELEEGGAGPDDTGPDDTGPEGTGQDDTGPDDTGPNGSGQNSDGQGAAQQNSPEIKGSWQEGLEAFTQAGCGACHTVRGLAEAGSVGPDLTHFAARSHLAAGTLPLSREVLADWLRLPQVIKPGALMPGYADLPEAELEKIITFLMGLR